MRRSFNVFSWMTVFHQTLTAAAVVALTLMLSGCGGAGDDVQESATSTSSSSSSTSTPARLELLAGRLGGSGSVDDIGALARFWYPVGTAADADGNVYVADAYNQTVRKVSPNGAVTTLAGRSRVSGYANGRGDQALFSALRAVAVSAAGRVYVADGTTIRAIDPDGTVTTLAGDSMRTGGADGRGSAATFSYPVSLTVDSSGAVYVADNVSSRGVIRQISPAGDVVTLSLTTKASGGSSAAYFGFLGSITVGHDGVLYVASDRAVYKVDAARQVSDFASIPSSVSGWGGTHLAVDRQGNVLAAYIPDNTVHKIAPDGVVSSVAGNANLASGSADGQGPAALFWGPLGISVDARGYAYVADHYNSSIRRIAYSSGVVTTLAGKAWGNGYLEGRGSEAAFDTPSGMAVTAQGKVFLSDSYNHVIRAIASEGVVSTYAGGGWSGRDDGDAASASFHVPSGSALDRAGNLYVVNDGTGDLRRVTPAGQVSTVANFWEERSANRFPTTGAAIDQAGNVYVTDISRSTIRKISGAGNVSTLAGGTYGYANGSGVAARFADPAGVAVDASGNVYVADAGNHVIRKVSPAGVVTTLAGKPTVAGHADGQGGAAMFNRPHALALDMAGNVYVADTYNNAIRRITPAGMVSTIVGVPGKAGVRLGALPARLNSPFGIAVQAGKLYITDESSVLVVKL